MTNPTGGHQLQYHNLVVLAGRYAICRLDAGTPIPEWIWQGEFVSVTRTPDELSVVCPESVVPGSVRADRDWRAFRVVGTQDLDLVGVLASLARPIAQADVSLFALATFDTDYLLIRAADMRRAVEALTAAGYEISGE